jgi:hypothetical protein
MEETANHLPAEPLLVLHYRPGQSDQRRANWPLIFMFARRSLGLVTWLIVIFAFLNAIRIADGYASFGCGTPRIAARFELMTTLPMVVRGTDAYRLARCGALATTAIWLTTMATIFLHLGML